MPSKGYPTLPQRQKKAQNNGQEVPDAHPGPNISERYVDAAKVLELTGDWPTSLAIRFFGPRLMGSMAFAIDPLAKFGNSFRKISDEKRRVDQETQVTDFVCKGNVHTMRYSNYFVDDSTAYPERVVEDYREQIDVPVFDRSIKSVSFLSDSVQSQRYKGQEFGTKEMLKDIVHRRQNRISYTTRYEEIVYIEVEPPYRLYDRSVTVTDWIYDGPIAFPVGNWCDQESLSNLLATSKGIATDRLFSMIPKTLSNHRLFNAIYQIVELKDIPQLARGLDDLARYVRTLIAKPDIRHIDVDKLLGGAYLTNLFGIQSIRQAIASYLSLPEKLTKRINYLLKKNRKVETGKARVNFIDSNFTYVSPNYTTFQLPGYVDQSFEEKVSLLTYVDIRCVVNQTVQFPELIAPKFSDKNYRDLMGLQLRGIDVYNLIPFTWLFDWYTGLGSYINMIEAVNDDRFLVNFGFMTVTLQPLYEHAGTFKVQDLKVTYRGDDVEVQESNIRTIPFFSKNSFTHVKRWSIADLDGSKTVDNKNGNLSVTQVSILGALFAKFT